MSDEPTAPSPLDDTPLYDERDAEIAALRGELRACAQMLNQVSGRLADLAGRLATRAAR